VSFLDVTLSAGLLNGIHQSNGAAKADVENDGDLDLYVANQVYTAGAPQNWLYQNNGDGTFTDIAASAGVLGGQQNMAVSFVDVDVDGWIDIYAMQTGGTGKTNALYHNVTVAGGNPTFALVTAPEFDFSSDATYATGWADYDQDGDPDALVMSADNTGPGTGDDALIRNDGALAFTDVTSTSGLNDVPLNGYPAWGDYDNDGDLDVYCTNWIPISGPVASNGQLYRNDGTLPFVNVTTAAGLATGFAAEEYTPQWADFDDDGDLDLFVATGKTLYGNIVFENQLVESGVPTFVNVSLTSGAWDQQQHMGAALVDVDNDGSVDVMTTNEQSGLTWGGPKLYHNVTPDPGNHRVRYRLEGTLANRAAIGVPVRATVGASTQLRVIGIDQATFGSSELVAHFGLGTATSATSVRVDWPSGVRQTLWNALADQGTVLVRERGLRRTGSSDPVPGSTVDVEVVSPSGDLFVLILGTALGPGMPMLPFGGFFDIDLLQPWFFVTSGTVGASNVQPVQLALPSNPLLTGMTFHFQSLQGSYPPSSNLSWLDSVTFTVQ
jgi:hypothetical protein